MKHSTIYVAYDKLDCDTICATTTMDEAITQTLRYMNVHEYICKEFCYDESFTIIEFEQDYRIGPTMNHVESTITIMETGFIQPDE